MFLWMILFDAVFRSGKKTAANNADVTQASETTEGSEIELAREDEDPDLLSTCSGNKKASNSPPFSSPRNMSETGEATGSSDERVVNLLKEAVNLLKEAGGRNDQILKDSQHRKDVDSEQSDARSAKRDGEDTIFLSRSDDWTHTTTIDAIGRFIKAPKENVDEYRKLMLADLAKIAKTEHTDIGTQKAGEIFGLLVHVETDSPKAVDALLEIYDDVLLSSDYLRINSTRIDMWMHFRSIDATNEFTRGNFLIHPRFADCRSAKVVITRPRSGRKFDVKKKSTELTIHHVPPLVLKDEDLLNRLFMGLGVVPVIQVDNVLKLHCANSEQATMIATGYDGLQLFGSQLSVKNVI